MCHLHNSQHDSITKVAGPLFFYGTKRHGSYFLLIARINTSVCVSDCVWNAPWGVWPVPPGQITPGGYPLGTNSTGYIYTHCITLLSKLQVDLLANEVQLRDVWRWSCIVTHPKGGSQCISSNTALKTVWSVFPPKGGTKCTISNLVLKNIWCIVRESKDDRHCTQYVIETPPSRDARVSRNSFGFDGDGNE